MQFHLFANCSCVKVGFLQLSKDAMMAYAGVEIQLHLILNHGAG
jgi:hypothetical protein